MVLILYVCTFCAFVYMGIHAVGSCKGQMNTIVNIDNKFPKSSQKDVEMFIYILQNNINSLFLNYLGIVTFGFYSVLSIFKNAGVFGYVFGSSIVTNGLNFSLVHTLPHSFELIPIILSASDGLYLGVNIGWNLIIVNNKNLELFVFLKRLCLYLILIALAAFFEVFISMKL